MEHEHDASKYTMHFEAGSNPTIIDYAKIDISVAGDFVYTATRRAKGSRPSPSHVPQAPAADKEARVRQAVDTARQDPSFRHLYDYAWIRTAMMDDRVGITFTTDADFLAYLKALGVSPLPSRSTLSRYMSAARRQGGETIYTDTADRRETVRRNNVARRFLAAYLSGE